MPNRYIKGTSNEDYFQKLALGQIPGHKSIYKFGRNPSVGSTYTLIGAGGIYGLPPTAQTVTVISDDTVNDVYPSGSGSRTIEIFGLDENWEEITEIVNMGATSIQSFLRVFRAKVKTSGTLTPTDGSNLGTINISQSSSLIDMIQIAPKTGQTLTACYTVPAGYIALMWSADTTTGEGKNATSSLKSRNNKNLNEPFQSKGIRDNFENNVGVKFKIPNIYEEKTDIVFTTISTAVGTPVSGTFILELIDLEYL